MLTPPSDPTGLFAVAQQWGLAVAVLVFAAWQGTQWVNKIGTWLAPRLDKSFDALDALATATKGTQNELVNMNGRLEDIHFTSTTQHKAVEGLVREVQEQTAAAVRNSEAARISADKAAHAAEQALVHSELISTVLSAHGVGVLKRS